MLVALLTSNVFAQEHPKFAFKTWVPGETTKDDWYNRQLAAETAWGHGGFYLHEVQCRAKDHGIDECSYQREYAYYTFYNGVLARIAVDYPTADVSAEDVHDQLVAKYGKPAKISPYTYRNDVGANVPFNRYEWNSETGTLIFSEVGSDISHCSLFIVDKKLDAAIKTSTAHTDI